MSLAIGVPDLVQCETASISWAGPDGLPKIIQTFLEGADWFAETLADQASLTGSAGIVNWLVDIPAGASVAIEIRNPDNSSQWTTSQYTTIGAGTSGSCLAQDSGQLATDSMALVLSSLESASPTYFPYMTLTASAPSAPTSSSASSTSSNSSSSASSVSTSSNSTSTLSNNSTSSNAGPIAGGVVGGFAIVALLSAALFFFMRARRPQTAYSSPEGSSALPSPRPPRSPRRGGLHPIEACRTLIAARPPSTPGSYVYSPTSPVMEDTHSSYPLRYSNGGGHAPQGSFGDGGPTSSAGQSRPYYAGVAEVQDAGVDPGYGGSYAGSHVGHSSVPHSIAPPRPYYPARAPEIMQEDDQGPRGSAGAGMLGWGTEAGGRGSGGLYGARMPATSEGQSSWSGLATEGGAYPSRPAA